MIKKSILYKEQWLLTISSGLFLFVVLYFYEGFGIPDGISPTGHGLLFRASSFGLLAGLIIFCNEAFLRTQFAILNYRQKIPWYLWELILIWNFTFLLINLYWEWDNLGWFAYFDLLGELSSVMIFPVALTEFFSWQQRKAEETRSNFQKLLFKAENGKEQVLVDPEDFLYITSEDNYIDIYFLQNGEVIQRTIRSSLKNVEESFKVDPPVIRCHRSFIINPNHIVQLSESSRGHTVKLSHNIKVPVSDKYLPILKEKLDRSDSSHI